eukprot:m.978518 g.978518  ORF g.978518 m.978518 type:complete len:512 (-) comp23959_c0_seq4:3194-4729(-)
MQSRQENSEVNTELSLSHVLPGSSVTESGQQPHLSTMNFRNRKRTRLLLNVIGVGVVFFCIATELGRTMVWNFSKVPGDLLASEGHLDARVAAYMTRKKQLIEDGRDDFLLWDYFDLTETLQGTDFNSYMWQDMINSRFKMWVGKQRATGDTRHALEKDKCVTMKVLKKLNLPHPTVRVMWNESEYSENALREYLLSTEFPAILKVGHIHQQKSTLFLPSQTEVRGHVDEYVSWTTDKMHSHFIDNNPTWKDSANILYAALHPCTFIQDVVNPEDFSEGNTARPWEVMVEVVWGQAIHAVFTVTVRGSLSIGGGQYKNTEEYMLLDDGWAVYKWPRLRWGPFNANSAVQRHRLNRETWFKATDPNDDVDGPERACGGVATPSERVACEQEYRAIQLAFWAKYAQLVPSMPRVWNLCTAFGHGVGADYMRCDVFITPSGVVSVNEISLSSNWGNALSPKWQASLIDLWLQGYTSDPPCAPEPKEGTCGSAYGGVFTSSLDTLPSPKYKQPSF